MSHQAPNYTQVPNVFFEEMMKTLNLVETRVILAIYRKTFGWHKIRDRISLSQLEEMTGSSRTNINLAVESLESKGMIKKETTGEIGNQKTYYEILFKEIYTSDKLSPPQSQIITPPSDKLSPTKETLTKETLTKEKKENRSVDSVIPNTCNSSPEIKQNARKFSLPFSLNEEKYIKNSLEKKGYSEEQVTRGLVYAYETEFWSNTLKNADGFIRNFDTILVQSPKPFDELSEEHKFKEMIKEVNRQEPLSRFHLILDMDKGIIYEKHYNLEIPLNYGVDRVYANILAIYKGTYWS